MGVEVNKIYNEDCLIGMRKLPSNFVDTLVTSPPYYNARAYSQWDSLQDYMDDMESIFTEVFRVLKNYHNIVVNVSDVVGKTGKALSTQRKLPLGAYFIVMLEKIGFRYIDDFIWDKGEVQSKRNFVGDSYPYQKYPINAYEHILVFKKIVDDDVKPKCPICHLDKVVVNGRTNGVKTYECKNPKCPQKSPSGRGKRFSNLSIMVDNYAVEQNKISDEELKLWRRDIVKINPVIKVNSKGKNIVKHTAPFPKDLPKMAITNFSGVNDLVLDCFMGSGTTASVAKELKRNYIGYELSEEYYNLMIEKGL